ncbi:hypothetical protein KEM55_000178 [Ascosphaera atra]|nr:hypothetical protein KEM55_000178 [Ascosphaera atra]
MPGGGLQTPQLMMPPTPEKPSGIQQQYFPHGAPAFLSAHNGFSGTSSGHGNWIPPPSQTAASNNGNGNDTRPLDAARFPNISHPDVYAAMHNEQHMVEASHHWWLNDQAALALSLENQRGLWNAQNDFRGPSSGVHTPAESSQMPSTMFNMQQPPTPEECRQTMHEPKVDGGNALPNAKVMHLPMNYHGYTYSSN